MSRLITEDAVYEYLTDKFNEYDISIENEFVGKILDGLGDIPTAYDIEKVVAELEEMKNNRECKLYCMRFAYNSGCKNHDKAIEIVNKLTEEYNNGWIPCSERLPKERESVFAKLKGTNKWRDGMFEKTSDDVNVTIEYKDGTRRTLTTHTVDGKWKKDYFADWEVIAWQPLPETYKPHQESEWKNKVMKHFTKVE